MRNKLDPDMKDRARALRSNATPAEQALRDLNRQAYHFRRQVPFRRYILDFTEHGRKIVIEVDGDTHAASDARLRNDERDRLLHSEGYRVLRFWNSEIRESVQGVVVKILAEIGTPTLTLPTRGRGIEAAFRGTKRIQPMPKNEAAWVAAQGKPLEVKDAPYTEPQAGEILVRNHAVAVNPVDWMIPYLGRLLFSWIKYPFILGSDLAGEVVAVGSGVADVKVGDRVLAMATGFAKQRNRAAEGAFQAYTIVFPRLTTIIPETMSYVDAAVIPLGVTTAACGLFQRDLLALELPTAIRQPREQWVIIWGGATSVGCNAIQLAAAAGYSVVTTASPKNFNYVKSLGAAYAFDYNGKNVIRDIVAALKGKEVVGALAIGSGSTGECLDILAKCRGRKFVASCSASVSFDKVDKGGTRVTLPVLLKILPSMLWSNLRTRRKSRRYKITEKFFDASSVIDNEIGPAIFRDYLGPALADGRFRPAPPPRVVGHGLQHIQTAFDAQRNGVSAAKIVVALD